MWSGFRLSGRSLLFGLSLGRAWLGNRSLFCRLLCLWLGLGCCFRFRSGGLCGFGLRCRCWLWRGFRGRSLLRLGLRCRLRCRGRFWGGLFNLRLWRRWRLWLRLRFRNWRCLRFGCRCRLLRFGRRGLLLACGACFS